MTIRSSNWCADCEEECRGHARVCTMCGGALTVRPTTTASSSSNSTRGGAAPSFRAMPELDAFLPGDVSTRDLLVSLRQQVQSTTELAQQAIDGNGDGDEWQAIPAGLLDPQDNNSTKRPTCREVLKKLPRETLHEKSACLFHVSIDIGMGSTSTGTATSAGTSAGTATFLTQKTYEGVTGELGPLPSLVVSSTNTNDITNDNDNMIQVSAPLWIPATRRQRTGKDALQDIPTTTSFIAVLERGDGISFLTKACAAQQVGAIAVIMMNDKSEPWPYVMKNSSSQQHSSVTIPVVMVSFENGQELLRDYCSTNNTTCRQRRCWGRITIQHKRDDDNNNNNNLLLPCCVVCRDPLQMGQTILTLTNYCGHAFHQDCVVPWLQHHNTCPYCRRTLPMQDANQEQERRRQMSTSTTTNTNNASATAAVDAFYS